MDVISKVSIISNYQSGATAVGDGDVFAGLSLLAFANNNGIAPEPFTSTSPLWPSDPLPLPLPDVVGTGTGLGTDTDTGTAPGDGGPFGGGLTPDILSGTGGDSTGGPGSAVGGSPAQIFAGMALNWLNNTISQMQRSGHALTQLAGGKLSDVDGLEAYAQSCLDAAESLQGSADSLAELLGSVPEELSGASASEVWSSLWGLQLRAILTGAATEFQAINDVSAPVGIADTGLASHGAGFWRNPFMGMPGWITGDSTLTEDFFSALDRGWLNGRPGWGQGGPSGRGTSPDTGNDDTGSGGTGSGDTGGAGGLFGLGNGMGDSSRGGAGLQGWVTNGENADWLSPILQAPSVSDAAVERYDALTLAVSAPAAAMALDDWLTAFLPSDGMAPFAFTTNPYPGSLPDAFAAGPRFDTQI